MLQEFGRIIGWTGPLLFVALLVACHLLRTDLDPIETAVSDYGRGQHAWVFASALVALSLAKFGVAAWTSAQNGALSRLGACILVLDGVATLVVAAARTDIGAESTPTGAIHRAAAGIAFIASTAAFLLVSIDRWRAGGVLGMPALAIAIIAALALLAFGLALAAGRGVGITERVLLATIATWLVLAASMQAA